MWSIRLTMGTLGVFAMASLLGASTLVAQTGTIAGTVTAEDTGQPVAAAQLFIQALDLGSLTQAGGAFTLSNVPAGTHTLTVQRLGYREVTVPVQVVAGQTLTLNLEIAEEALQLDEIIVTGTAGGTQRRALGNVVARVDMSSLREIVAPTSVEKVLTGRVAGVRLNAVGGFAGSDSGLIRIRGSSSVGLDNSPIVFVDGIRINAERTRTQGGTYGMTGGSQSRLNDINPDDIESIEIIKGPAAGTLYGTEASNGVIQIITKRGVVGAPVFDASVELGVSYMPNPNEEFGRIYGTHPTSGELLSFELYKLEEETRGKAWFTHGPMQRYSLSVRGGTEAVRYFASVNRSDETGYVDWNWAKNSSGRLSITANLSETLSVDLSAMTLHGTSRHPGRIWAEFVRARPARDLRSGGLDDRRRGFGIRPIEIWRDGHEDRRTIDRTSWSLQVVHQPFSWLDSRLTFGRDFSADGQDLTITREEGAPDGFWGDRGLGSRDVGSLFTTFTTVDYSGTARFRRKDDQIGFATSSGIQYYNRKFHELDLEGEEFASAALRTISSGAIRSAEESFEENTTLGVYIQQQLDWEERIFLTAAVRGDDNSAFGTDFDVIIYPKFSATWVVHEESFWNLDFVDQLRLRGAWGQSGQQPDAFASERLYQPRTGVGNEPILSPSSFGNAELGPEVGEEFELGFDAAFWGDRVQVEYTHYNRTTKNAIVPVSSAPSSGFPGTIFKNIGQVSGWGDEVTVDLQILNLDAVRFDLNMTLSSTHTRVDDLGGIERLRMRRTRYHVEGYPLAAQFEIKALSADFVTGTSGAVTNAMCDGGTGPDGQLLGGAPVPCADAPLLYWGRPAEPTWTVGINPTFTLFQNLRLAANIETRGGNIVTREWIGAMATAWKSTKLTNTLTDPLYNTYLQFRRNALGFAQGGFSILREAGLSYTLPPSLAGRLGASRASLSVSIRNAFVLWHEGGGNTIMFDENTGHPERSISSAEDGINQDFFGGIGESTAGSSAPAAQIIVGVRMSF